MQDVSVKPNKAQRTIDNLKKELKKNQWFIRVSMLLSILSGAFPLIYSFFVTLSIKGFMLYLISGSLSFFIAYLSLKSFSSKLKKLEE